MRWPSENDFGIARRLGADFLVDRFAADANVVATVTALILEHGIATASEVRLAETGAILSVRDAPAAVEGLVRESGVRFSPTPTTRALGMASLRWASALAIFDADEYLVRPISDEWRWGNTVSVSVPLGRWKSGRAIVRFERFFMSLADALGARYGNAYVDAEWNAIHLRITDDTIETTGKNIATDPLSIFWLAYFPLASAAGTVDSDAWEHLGIARLDGHGIGLRFRTSNLPWPTDARIREAARHLLGDGGATAPTLGQVLNMTEPIREPVWIEKTGH